MSDKKKWFSGLFGRKKESCCCNFEIVEEAECDCSEGCCPSIADNEKQTANSENKEG